MKTKAIFCANEQEVKDHSLEVDNNGEIVATCVSCERFIKIPATQTAAEAEAIIVTHKESNTLSEAQAQIEEARKTSENTIDKIAD